MPAERSSICPPPAVILAGGLARRMGGGDKGLRLLGGRPILDRVIDRLAPQVGALALNANGDPSRLAGYGLPVLPDPVPGTPGPLAGILAAMDWAAGQGAAQVVTLPADTPFFPDDLVSRLLFQGRPLVLAASDEGRQPVIGLWPVALRGALKAALQAGMRRVGEFADAHGAVAVRFANDPFFNINTPEDLRRAEALIEGAGDTAQQHEGPG